MKKSKAKEVIHCHKCESQSDCCKFGAWIDLEEAKKIISAGIKGDFFHLEVDEIFPSGFKVGTSIEDNPCVFLDPDGLCRVHKFDYSLKPVTCIEFPLEDGKLSSFAEILCTPYKKHKLRSKKRRLAKKK